MSPAFTIFYFSGTGNTQVVAQQLAAELKTRGSVVALKRLEDVLKGKAIVDWAAVEEIGIGCPVLGFDAPRNVCEFIRSMPAGKGRKVFIFTVASDPAAINHGAALRLRGLLKHKGYEVFHESLFAMPCNWLIKYNDRLARQLADAVPRKVALLAEEILSQKVVGLPMNVSARCLTRLLGMGEDLGARFFGKDLRVLSQCTHCHRCVQECPTGNIQLREGKIVFGWDCIFCMRCIYRCPAGAISPRFQKFCVLKGGYDIQSIVDSPDLKGDFVTPDTRGYFAHFRDYLLMDDAKKRGSDAQRNRL